MHSTIQPKSKNQTTWRDPSGQLFSKWLAEHGYKVVGEPIPVTPASDVTVIRKKLRDAGYDPIPIIGKIPPLKKWETKIDIDDDEIETWTKDLPKAKSTGILTRRTPTLDIDIKIPEAAIAVEQLVRERFASLGKILVRTGNAPKRAIPFRTNAPFKKITANLIAPDGNKGQKLELLADGQQFVAFGIHEDTRKPYTWTGGEPGKIKRDGLPLLDNKQAIKLVEDAAELLIRDHGYKRAKQKPNENTINGPGGTDQWQYLTENIRAGHEFHDSLRDLSAKLVTAGMSGGAAVNFLYALMDASEAKQDHRWFARRGDIKRLVASAEGMQPIEEADEVSSDPDPVDLWGKFDPPELPRGVLPKLIEDYAFLQGKKMGVDPGGVAAAALAICASAIPDRIMVRMRKHDDEWRESARIWVGLVGLPSTKKTPIINAAVAPLAKADAELLRQYMAELANYNALSKDEKLEKGAEPPLQKRLRLKDTTIEAAQEVLLGSPDGPLLHQDELSGWFGSMDKYSGRGGAAKDRGFWLESFNGGPYPLNRIGRGTSIIPNHSTNVLGGIQPDIIRKLSTESYDDGFLQRMLLIVLRAAVVGQDAPAPPVAADYAKLINRLLELTPPAKSKWNVLSEGDALLYFDAKAQALLEELDQRHVTLQLLLETVNKKLATSIGKYNGYFGKLCVLFHCVEHAYEKTLPPVVTGDTARRVSEFIHGFVMPHAVAFYSGVLDLADDHDRIAAVAGFILSHKLERVTNRDINRGDGTMRKLKEKETEEIFEQLEALGWVNRTVGGRTTKAGTVHWRVNPKVHVLFAERAMKETERRSAARKLILEKVLKGKGQS